MTRIAVPAGVAVIVAVLVAVTFSVTGGPDRSGAPRTALKEDWRVLPGADHVGSATGLVSDGKRVVTLEEPPAPGARRARPRSPGTTGPPAPGCGGNACRGRTTPTRWAATVS